MSMPTRDKRRCISLKVAGLAASLLILSFPVPAGCMSDCKDKYQSDVEDCHHHYDSPDESDDLRRCIDDAKCEYDDCVEECKS
jgi:hypothetical protein